MALARYDHQGGAVATTLSSSINSSDTSIAIASSTGWPSGATGPFYISIDRGLVGEERILIQSRSGTTLTVAASGRGKDGTTAAAHSTGAAVEHVYTAVEADDTNAHIYDTSRDDHTQLLNTTRHDVTARHTFGAALGTPGAASASAPGDAAAAGVGSVPARSDHTHGRTDTFATPAFTLGTANAAGSGSNIVRANATIAAFDASAPTTSAVGDAAATGSQAVAARRDHVHGREAFGAVTAVAAGDASANGAATTLARSDHNHGWPAAIPRGTVAFASVTANQTGISTETDLTGLTVTFTTLTGRRYRIEVYAQISSTNAASAVILSIKEGATLLNAWQETNAIANGGIQALATAIVTPTAASHTYKATLQVSAGTSSLLASATQPAWFMLTDIGV